jgi:hypothetical protein
MTRFGIVHPNDNAFSIKRLVASGGAATIDRGAPTKEGSSGAVAIMTDGEGTTSERFSGIAKSVSTDTAAADGAVEVYLPLPGLVYVGSPKVAGAADTEAELLAIMGKRIVLDLTSTVWTVDTAATDAIGNAVVIVGGDYNNDLVYFVVTHTTLNFFEDN